MDVILDIGANAGDFALSIAERNPGVQVLALEPIPELCAQIRARANGVVPNLTVLAVAADLHARTAVFHIADHADLGVSSLLKFDESGLAADEYWRTRQDLYFDRTLDVEVVRLDSLPQVADAERIRFIKIDAQGLDLEVLESLGEHLARTECGMLEIPATRQTRLYADEAHDLRSAMNRLQELGFRVYAIKPNDHASNEFNVFFCRADLDHAIMEETLQLRGIHLYDGKHFWHAPSHALQLEASVADTARLVERLRVVEEALARESAETRRLNEMVGAQSARLFVMNLAAGKAT